MVKIIFIGCGQIGILAHLPALKSLQAQGLVEIAGVCDVDLEKAKAAANQFGITNFGADWKQMVKDTGADAVSVCLPPGINAEISTQAIEMGLHVLCEKPPGRNLVQAERMARAASAHPEVVSMIAFNRRHAPLYTHAMKYSLQFGNPHVFYGRFIRPSLGADPSNTVKDWITSDASHTLDLAIATIGFPTSVSVTRKQVGSDVDNVWTIQLSSDSGSAVLLFDFAAGRRVERFEWSGPGYDVLLELPNRGEWSQQGETVQHWIAEEMTQSNHISVNYGFLGEYRYFIDAIVGNSPRPQADFNYGVSFMHLVKTILECPSGELRPVLQPDTTEKSAKIQHSQQLESVVSRSERPIVQVLQSPAGQTRFFDLEQLSRVSEYCELRLGLSNGDQKYDITDAEVLITGWAAAHRLSPEDLKRAQQLKLVIVIGASVKALQPEQLIERKILVCNTADAIAQSVAEHCLLVTLAGLRNLIQVDALMHRGGWNKPVTRSSKWSFIRLAKKLPGVNTLKPILRQVVRKVANKVSPPTPAIKTLNDLQGQVVGLIGWGYTAQYFARLLQSFNCKLLVCSESVSTEELNVFNARRATLGEVLGSAKVISLHKGLTEQNQGMIGAKELAMIKSGSVLVNTARGGLIDEQALIERLKLGDIVVALDVFHEEPLPEKHPLRGFSNVILSPHNASTTPECDRRVGEQALNILQDFLAQKPVPTIKSDRLAKMT